MIETGFALLDALLDTLVNNPIESIVFIAMVVFAYKFFGIGDCHRRHEVFHDFISWWRIEVRYFLPRLVDNRGYSYCRMEVDCIERVYSIIKVRYAYTWRQREIIASETGLGNAEITQIIDALVDLGRIEYKKDENSYYSRLLPTEKLLTCTGVESKK